MLRDYKIVSSMSARGDCFDNGVAESVFGRIKTERIYTREYETLSEVQQDLFRYIEGFYNRRRMHSYAAQCCLEQKKASERRVSGSQ